MGENEFPRSLTDRRLVPPESCVLHESWLTDIRGDLKDLKVGQEKSIDRVEVLLEKHKDKTEVQIDRLWNNGISEVRTDVGEVKTRVTALEVKDSVEDTFKARMNRNTNDSTLKTFIKAIPKEAWILIGVALLMYGPSLITALGTFF